MADQNSPDPLISVDNDFPISEVVALSETKPAPPAPVVPVETPAVKSPLFEDPDEIVVKRTL